MVTSRVRKRSFHRGATTMTSLCRNGPAMIGSAQSKLLATIATRRPGVRTETLISLKREGATIPNDTGSTKMKFGQEITHNMNQHEYDLIHQRNEAFE